MTVPSNKKMYPDFIKRTLKIIKGYDKYCTDKNISEQNNLKFTLLINCLLGLIVFIYERKKDQKFLQEDIFDMKKIPKTQAALRTNWIKKLSIQKFLYHFRNAISHRCIKAVIYNEWIEIRKEVEIWDKNPHTNKITFKKIILPYDEILIISKSIARMYTKN